MGSVITTKKAEGGKWALLIALIVLGIIFSGNIFAKDLRKLREKSIDVKSGEKLVVSTPVADVNIRTWDKDQFNIIIYGNSKAEDRMEFSIEKTSYGVKVKGEKNSSWLSNLFGSNIQAKFDIMVPRNFQLDISTSGGDITVGNLSGFKKLHTSGGDIELSNTDGELEVKTSGGDIKVHKNKGLASLETSGGDIIVKECTGNLDAETSGGDLDVELNEGKVSLGTSGGDIKLNYSGENKGIKLSTSGGDITAWLPSSIKADAELVSTGGDVTCRIKSANTGKYSSHRFIGTLNGGGAKLTARTTGGEIIIKEK